MMGYSVCGVRASVDGKCDTKWVLMMRGFFYFAQSGEAKAIGVFSVFPWVWAGVDGCYYERCHCRIVQSRT